MIFILTHLPAKKLPTVDVDDKAAHLLAYAGLGALLYVSLWLTNPNRRGAAITVMVIGLIYAAIDEWLQLLVGRDCELGDWIADAAGLCIAVVILSLIRRFAAVPVNIPEPS